MLRLLTRLREFIGTPSGTGKATYDKECAPDAHEPGHLLEVDDAQHCEYESDERARNGAGEREDADGSEDLEQGKDEFHGAVW